MIRILRLCLVSGFLASCGTDQGPSQEPAEGPDEVAQGPDSPAPPQDAPPANEDGPAPLTADGWGPLRIGMTLEEVIAAAGEDANPSAVGGPNESECNEFRPSEAPEGLLVMVENGVLTRISIFRDSEVKTDAGFGVGDSAAEIKAAYGSRAESSLHKYVPPPAEYITIWSSPPDSPEPRGIVYEVGEDGLVTHVHAGGPSIQYVEGCL